MKLLFKLKPLIDIVLLGCGSLVNIKLKVDYMTHVHARLCMFVFTVFWFFVF